MNINVLNNQHKFKATHEDSVVSLDKFLYVQDKKKKYILLRFYNGLTNNVNAISFDVYFYAKGKVLGMKRMRDVSVHSTAQNCFYFPKKISVPSECDSFAIENIITRAGYIEYRLVDGQVEREFYDLSAIPNTDIAKDVLGSKHVETNLKSTYKTTRVLCLMFAFMAAIVIALLPLLVIQQQHDTCETFSLDNISYVFLDDDRDNGNIAVTGYDGAATTVVIPQSIEGLKVVSIADNAFENNTSIESVYIEGDVSIGKKAFNNCLALSSIDFGKVSYIGEEAFANTAITTIDCTNCTYIGNNAFVGCSALSEVKFNNNTTLMVGTTPFDKCGTIANVSILQNITFENSADTLLFGNTTVQSLSFKNYPFINEAMAYIPLRDIMVNLQSLYIESIDTIPDYFCMNMVNLQSVKIDFIGDNAVGNNAFKSCGQLVTFETPALKSVGDNSFNGTGLTSFNFDSLEYIGNSAFASSDMTISLNKCKKLTYIGNSAFSGCKNITSLSLASNVTLGDGVFENCKNLTSIYFPNATTIPARAFSGCTSLNNVELSENLTKIGDYAFAKTAISKIELPDSVTEIGLGAYDDADNITYINIPFVGGSQTSNNFLGYIFGTEYAGDVDKNSYPEGLASVTIRNAQNIGENAFYLLSTANNINISGTCTTIGRFAFSKCYALTSIIIPTSVLKLESDAFSECSILSRVSLPKDILEIGDDCFSKCYALTNINLGSKLEKIGAGAFENTSISKFNLPETVKNIGKGAFAKCPVTEITLPNCVSNISEKGNQTFGYFFGSSTIEDGNSSVPSSLKKVVINKATSINQKMFYGLKNITEINLPDALTTIAESAFEGCEGLETINIPSTIKLIKASAFKDCSKITSVNLSPSLEKIEKEAFSGCAKLANVTFANASTSTKGLTIGEKAFKNTGLTSLVIPSYVSSYEAGILLNTKSLESLTIPNTKYTLGYIFGSTYKDDNSKIIPTSLKSVTILSGTEIIDDMFFGAKSVETVAIPDTITTIGSFAFEDCNALTTINLPNGLKTISEKAFRNTALVEVVIPNTVTSLGFSSFENESGTIISITLPNCLGTHNIGYIFGGTQSSTTIDNSKVPETLKTIIITSGNKIQDNMFYGLINLDSITLPQSITSVGANAFYNCTSITELVIPSNVTSIGKDAFKGCSALTTLTIPVLNGNTKDYEYLGYYFGGTHGEGIEDIALTMLTITNENTIPDKAFLGISSLRSVILNDTITKIGEDAFKDCINLSSINIPTSTTEIGKNAFRNDALTMITIPSSLGEGSILDNAFEGCIRLYVVINNSELILANDDTNGCVAKYAIIIGGKDQEYQEFIQDGYKVIGIEDNYTLIDYDRTKTGTITLPTIEGVNSYKVASYLFDSNDKITSVVIPSCVTEIGDYAFNNCTNIASIDIKDATSLVKIGSYGFRGVAIEELVLPEGITTICDHAFYSSSNLYYVAIPSTLESIGASAFDECTLLLIVNNISDTINLTLGETNNGCVAKYASVISNNSESELNIKSLSNGIIVKYAGNIHIVVDYTGTNCSLTNLVMAIYGTTTGHDDATFFITKNTFKNNNTLQKVTIGKNFTFLPENAFEGCENLEEVIFETGSTISAIPAYAFKGCTKLSTITLPNSIISIGAHAFDGCASLTTINIPNNVLYIEESTFEGCTSLISITLPSTLTAIKANAFKNCSSLQWITIPEDVETIGTDAFLNCTHLYQVNSYSNITNGLTVGSDSLGYLAKYAISILGPSESANFDKHIEQYTDKNGFHFYKGLNDKWYLKSYYGVSSKQLTLPEVVKDKKVAYTVLKNAIDTSNITSIIIPELVTINNNAFTSIETTGTIYYKGTATEWVDVDAFNLFNGWAIYYYAKCVHEDGQWSYDSNNNVITDKSVTSRLVSKATCTSPAVYEFTCAHCSEKWTDTVGEIDEFAHNLEDGTCVDCNKTRVRYKNQPWLRNDSADAFSSSTSNNIVTFVSTNHDKNTTSTITININSDDTQLLFDWKLVANSKGSMVIAINGETKKTSTTNSTSFTTEKFALNSGDVVTISYINTLTSDSTCCLTISDLQLLKVVE